MHVYVRAFVLACCLLRYSILSVYFSILSVYSSTFWYISVYFLCYIGKPVVDIKWSVEDSEAGHIVSTPVPNDIGIIGNVTPNITLFCQVSSSSVSQSFSIFWYFRGQPVLRNSSFPRLLNDSTLFLSNSNGSMGSFLGSIQCLVRGEYHWGSSHVRIVIGSEFN